ncbi:MAG: urease accessory protein UreE [Rhodobacter sp.]|nr:urease accessory protein UreE [Rhodobacter sp.]
MTLPVSRAVRRNRQTNDTVVLDFEARSLRRRVLTSAGGLRFLVDLAQMTSFHRDDAFILEDGRVVGIIPAEEELFQVRGDLTRLAWHIGNRHTPCQIERDRLLIQRAHVMRDMLIGLGATVTPVTEPFDPEGGAYGNGRIHTHEQ